MPHNGAKKRYKDPVYGYIELDPELFSQFIDTPEFQRLRCIKQTGYMPVYSSATHNRFVHSVGVYFLGTLAIGALYDNSSQRQIPGFDEFEWDRHKDLFLKACLLHDIGHAPFSHTGEGFYKESTNDIDKQLVTCVDCDGFDDDVQKLEAAAPHEIMSAILGLTKFGDHFENSEDRDFFARCITGYHYHAEGPDYEIKNAIISLLNSKTIDVDKLDYLIRDAFVTGFKTTTIDYERLLSGLTLCVVSYRAEDDEVEKVDLAYRSGAISVLENVVLARDSERRWIQNHPVILYEKMLLERMLKSVAKEYFNDVGELFCLEALTEEGKQINGRHIRLLSDDDILSYAKQLDRDRSTTLYFNRGSRHKPFWKSEEEFNALVGSRLTATERDALTRKYNKLEKHLVEVTGLPFVNIKAIDKLKKRIKKMREEASEDVRKASSLDKNIKSYEASLNTAIKLYDLAGNHSDCELAVITTKDFNSGFASNRLGDTLISVSIKKKPVKLSMVSTLFEAEGSDDEFFYIYSNGISSLSAHELGDWISRNIKEESL